MTIRIAAAWAAMLSLAHYLIYAVLYQGAILPCSDSNYYLWLSHHLGEVNPDRPNGFPFLLAILNGLAGLLHFPFRDLLPAFVHGFVIFASLCWAHLALSGAPSRRATASIGATLALIQLFPLTLLYSSAIFMTDPISIYLVIVAVCLLAGTPSPRRILCISGLIGCLGLLRSGMVITISIFAIFISWKLFQEKTSRTRNISAAILLIFAPTICYQNFLLLPKTGSTVYGFIGGKCTLTQIITQLNCQQLTAIGRNETEKSQISQACLEGETQKAPPWHLMWDDNTFFTRYEKISGDNHAAANKRYEAWALRGALFYPALTARAAYLNVAQLYKFPLTNEFLLLRPYGFQPNCLENIAAAYDERVDQYYLGFFNYTKTNHRILQSLDTFNETAARYLFSISMLLLLCPFLWGFRPFVREPVFTLAYLIALEKFLACSFGVYYDTRHFMSFAILSFFQFTIFLSSAWKDRRSNPAEA